MTDLRKLIEAVEGDDVMDWGFHQGYPRKALGENWISGYAAFNGSLDAAKALHEALLPEWLASVGFAFDGGEVLAIVGPTGREDRDHEGKLIGPSSRAWLLAILKAYEEQQ